MTSNGMNLNGPHLDSTPVQASFDRRGLFRIGGITIATAALVAACADNTIPGPVGRVGTGADNPALKDPVLNDGVLLRTAASVELSIAEAYKTILSKGWLAKAGATLPKMADQSSLVQQFADFHTAAAATYNQQAVAAGATAWDCGNPRLDSAFVKVIIDRVGSGVAATDNAKAIEVSDDPNRDAIMLVYTLEALAAASAQALVPQLSQPAYRAAAMAIGVREARQSALVALHANPGAYFTYTDQVAAQPSFTTTTVATADTQPSGTAPLTVIPLPTAVPSQFGSLAGITYIGGNGDENGVRLKLLFETPSLNSLVYPFDECSTTTA